MKLWTQTQIFFIYDTKFCSREEDDPRDAILYFHPSQMPDSLRCALCGQLMGLAQFSAAIFSAPTLIRLQRSKVALKSVGRYTLALSGSLGMPDPVLRRQLQALYEMFVFYHNSIDKLNVKCGSKLDFTKKLSDIFECYLPVSQHFGNTHSLTFSVLPSLDLPKSAGSLFLQASHILQACQERDGVIAGCILCRNQIVCSQLPPTIVRNLCFISSTHPQLPAEEVSSEFSSPAGVKRVVVYLTEDQVNEICAYNTRDVAACSHNGAEGFQHSSSSTEDRRKERSSSDSTKYYTESSSESESFRLRSSSPNADSTSRARDVAWESAQASNPSKRNDSLYSDSSFMSSDVQMSKSLESLTIESPADGDREVNGTLQGNEEYRKANSRVRPSELFLKTSVAEVETKNSQNSNSRADQCSLDYNARKPNHVDCTGEISESARPFSLYVQGHSESQLILLMEEKAAKDPDTVGYVWKVGLSSLVDLEIDINNCVERSPKKEPSSTYLYVQYDRVWNTLRGDLASSLPASATEQLFSRTVQLSHEALSEDPLLQEITLRFGNTVVYSHCVGSTETHLQQQLQPTSDYSLLSLDVVAAIGDQAKKKLEQDHCIVLL